MEENRKRLGGGGSDGEEITGKRFRTPSMSEESEEMEALLNLEDESVNELAKLLESEVESPVKVRFIEYPYSSPLIFQSSPSSSYVTINGNEESCGSSFSDGESSVMASIDTGGIDVAGRDWLFPASYGGAWVLNGEVARGVAEETECGKVNQINGCNCSDIDDEMLARFIGEDLYD
ncbi:uncharacterized protein LOC130784433 [Actinidia eriantha]|uniref:uncharacterized protein LOC130784433 n=1 Tax=Actinidia eriantha TaxID=165200 RepID=UPI002589E468|nr:uncharacterized protein LOC130784433 [Actinidia eriantha]